MTLKSYKFEVTSGKMLGIVMLGRRAEVECRKITIQQLSDRPHATITFSGKEEATGKTFFMTLSMVPFNKDNKVYYDVPKILGYPIKYIEWYRVWYDPIGEIEIICERNKYFFGYEIGAETVTHIKGSGMIEVIK